MACLPTAPLSDGPAVSFDDIVSHANDAVVVTDAATRCIVYVNPAFSALTRYGFDEAIGRSPGALLQGPQTDPATVAQLREALQRQSPIRTEILNYDKDHRAYWLDINLVPLRDRGGEVTHFAAIERDVTEQRRERDMLLHVATTDPLTGLANRRAFHVALKREIHHAHRVPAPLGLIAFDLDRFKQVNDTHGHHAGDALLQSVATRFAPLLRAHDLLARTGGEEFHVLLPGTPLAQSQRVAERLRLALCREPVAIGLASVDMSASFGVVAVPLTDDDGSTSLMLADRLMYLAKAAGRNRVVTQSMLNGRTPLSRARAPEARCRRAPAPCPPRPRP